MTDTFRKHYIPLSDEAKDHINHIKDEAMGLENSFLTISNREMSIAKTKLEEAIMWATKAIVLDDEKNG